MQTPIHLSNRERLLLERILLRPNLSKYRRTTICFFVTGVLVFAIGGSLVVLRAGSLITSPPIILSSVVQLLAVICLLISFARLGHYRLIRIIRYLRRDIRPGEADHQH